ncbi:MAG: hypothetical protein LQ342_005847 [Letrouitia transgressa]|nr:MAG: hypothetical protein LQ342_005847 [Letrouitia transgressa]
MRRSYKDGGPILDLCVEAQHYYRQFSYQTRVKAAGGLTVEEMLAIAGVDSLTIAPALLRTLSEADELEETAKDMSLFEKGASTEAKQPKRLSFINDEAKFREAFSKADGGQGVTKTRQIAGTTSPEIEFKPALQRLEEGLLRQPKATPWWQDFSYRDMESGLISSREEVSKVSG